VDEEEYIVASIVKLVSRLEQLRGMAFFDHTSSSHLSRPKQVNVGRFYLIY
jgi:hypothetical protein